MHRIPNIKTKGQKNAGKLIKKLFNADETNWTTRLFLEKLFWAVVYASGLVLTALSCNDLYKQYQLNPTAKTDSNVHNKSITLPSPTVCLPFFLAQEKKESYYKSKSETDEWKTNQSTWAYVNNLNKFFGSKPWTEIRNADWPVPMIIVAQNFLSVVYATESLSERSSSRPLQQLLGQQDNISLAITKSLIPKMKEWNVTLLEFRNEFSRQFQDIYPITFNYSDSAAENMTRELVFVNNIQVCFHLGFENFPLGPNSSLVLELGNIYATCPDVSKNISNPKYCDVGFPPATVDLTGQARAGSIYRDFDNIYTVPFKDDLDQSVAIYWDYFYAGYQFTITPLNQYIALPVVRGVAMCSPDKTKEVCRGKCRNNIIQHMCNCSAVTVPSASHSAQPSSHLHCSFKQYESCMMNFTGSEDAECVGRCLDFCTTWTWDVMHQGLYEPDLHDYYSYVKFIVPLPSYTVTTESLQWTLLAIVGVIGGAAGFWLGLDIANVLYSLITAPLILLSRKILNQNNNNQEAVIEIELARTEVVISNQKLFDKSWNIKDPVFVMWVVQKLIWSALFLAGAVLTIIMFVQLIQQYLQGGTQTNMNVMFNDTITVPDAAVCFGAGQMSLLSYGDPMYEIGYVQSELQNFMNQPNMNKETFLRTENWPPTLTFMAYVYLFTLSAIIEEGTPPYVPFSNEQLVLNLTRSILLKFSVSNEELQQKLAIEYMKLENIASSCYSSTENITVQILPTKATFETAFMEEYIGAPLWLCLHLPWSSFKYRSTNDICSIRSNTESYFLYSHMYFVLKSSTTPYQRYYFPDFTLYPGESKFVTLTYSTIYQNSMDCNNTYTSFWDCWDKCRTEIAARECTNCTISASSKTSANILQCTMDEYVSCLKTAPFAEDCDHQCRLPSCTVANPEWSLGSPTTCEGDYCSELHFQQKEFNYILMEEQLVMTKSDFFANSGGLLGFWLGLDCTFFISIVFTPSMLIVGVLYKKMLKDTSSDPVETNMEHTLLLTISKVLGIDTTLLATRFIIKALFERIFWLVVYIVFGAFTLNMSINFHQQYFSNPIGSSSFVVNNENYTIPPVTLCIPWPAFPDSDNTDQDSDQDFEFFTGLPVTEMKQLIFNTSSTWPTSLLRVSFQYLWLMEGYKMMDQVDLSNMWHIALQYPNTRRAIDILSKNLDTLMITTEELMQQFGQEMLWRDSIIVKKFVENEGLPNGKLMTINRTTFVSSSTICFSLPQETTSFASVADYFTIQSSLPFPNDISELYQDGSCSSYAKSAFSMTLDVLGRQTGTPMDDSVLDIYYFHENHPVSITIDRVIRALPEVNGVRRCSDATSQGACMDECRVYAIEQQCNCTLGSDGTKTERHVCSWTTFENCLPQFSMINASNCFDKCLPSCERIYYVLTMGDGQRWESMKPTACYLGKSFIGLNSFRYRLYAEQLQWSFYSYVAGLGGVLGIFLGIDVTLLIECLFTVANWLFSFVGWFSTLPKKKTMETNQNVEKETEIGRSGNKRGKSKIIVVRPISV